MLSGLQPRSTAELLDLATHLVRARFWVLVGLMALLTLPTVGLQAVGFSLSMASTLGPITDTPALSAGAVMGVLFQNLGNLLQALVVGGLAPLVVAQIVSDELSGERHSRASQSQTGLSVSPPPHDPTAPFVRGRDVSDWLLLTLAVIGLVIAAYALAVGLGALLVIVSGGF